MFGKSALPLISESVSKEDSTSASENASNVLFTAGLVAIPGGIGIALMSREILGILFPARMSEVAVSVLPLSVLGIAVIFLCLSTAIFAVLQAAGRADLPLKIMVLGVAVKLILNLILVRIPEIGITGAAIATFACYLVIYVLSLAALKKVLPERKNPHPVLWTITLAGALCGIAARSASTFLHIESPFVSLVVSIGIGFFIYVAVIWITQRDTIIKAVQ
jgi:stage V sporulation protein B